MTADAGELTALEASELISRRALSPVELLDAVLRKIERANPTLGAFLTVTPELATEQARAAEQRATTGTRLGPLDGIPCSLKDLEPVANVRTTYGSAAFARNVATEDGIVAERIRRSGLVLTGKTNTPSFGHKDSCDNLLGPPCRNPWDLERTSGGSSGGAAAAVAAGLGPIAQGSDGAGSVRIPAAFCGVVGFKPSHGRIPMHPAGDYWGRSHVGPIARTVRDAAMLLSVLAGPDPRDPGSIDAQPDDYTGACDGDIAGWRVAWSPDLSSAVVDPAVAETVERAVHAFSDLGCHVEPVEVRWTDPTAAHQILYEVQRAAQHGDRVDKTPELIEPTLQAMVRRGREHSGVEFMRAVLARSAYYDQVAALMRNYDLLVTPQMPLAPWPVGNGVEAGEAEAWSARMYERTAFTVPFNMTGLPAISVPCGFTSEGLPVGLQIVGPWHADSAVLRAAACFEASRPWLDRTPPAVPDHLDRSTAP